MDATSEKFELFKAELIALCKKHGVQISAGYAAIEVLDLVDGDDPIFGDAIIDATNPAN